MSSLTFKNGTKTCQVIDFKYFENTLNFNV